jgi:hypothetical protein
MLHGLNVGIVSAQAAAYLLEQSLLFNDNDSAYLSRTPSTAGNRKTWTFSVWIKLAKLDTAQTIFNAYTSGTLSETNFLAIGVSAANKLVVSSGTIVYRIASASQRDATAWGHLVVAMDTTDQTVSMYWNGSVISSFTTNNAPTLNADLAINNTLAHRLGAKDVGGGVTEYFNGLMALPILVDGAALDPTSFGELDDDGYWNPIDFTGATTTTDNVSVGGTATAETTFLTYVPANAFDGNTSTRWISSATPAWLEYDRGSGNGVISTSYSISCGPSGTASTADMPKNWTIEGYNGSSWDTLATVTGEAAWSLGETRLYTFTNTTSYEKYRIDVTLQQGGGAEIEIGELTFYASGTGFGANGFELDYADTADFGNDISGNGNDYTPNNFTAADQLSDTPTDSADDGIGNFATWGLANYKFSGGSGAPDFSDGNLVIGSSAYDGAYKHTWSLPSTGKWAVKLQGDAGISTRHYAIGIMPLSTAVASAGSVPLVSGGCDGYAYGSNGNKFDAAGSESAYGSNWGTGAVIEAVWDADNGDLICYYDGVSQGTLVSGLTGEWVFFFIINNTTRTFTFDFGQRGYTPTDTSANLLATQNLPAPTIADGSDYFNTVLYTGNGVAIGSGGNPITGVGFQPDFVWIKSRSNAYSNLLYDVVRGPENYLISNSTGAEVLNAEGLSSIDSDGFTVGSALGVNDSGATFVAWCWKAGGAASSNTDGSITSSVSVNTTSGFSIVSYTGDTSGTPTVGHGLGVSPAFLIFKDRAAATEWLVWHKDLANTEALELNSTAAKATGWTGHFNSTTPGASVITLGTSGSGQGRTNPNGNAMICYAWAEIENFSKFGSFEGNGSTDGPFVYCGFRPAFVLIKDINSGVDGWAIEDAVRDTYNPVSKLLLANSTSAELTPYNIDFLSNGFKIRTTTAGFNTNTNTMIFAAYAENPFQGGAGTSQGRAR